MQESGVSRRTLLRSAAGATGLGATAALAGCSGSANCSVEGAAESVLVGPGQTLIFEPERVTVGTGDTVAWCFESAGHNVSAIPEHSEEVSIPDGAEPFASCPRDAPFRTNATGETYAHTFETPGEYTYVCVPHASQGMVGTVVVE